MIVGGSRGIGAATAIRCAEEGADVVITYRSNSAAAQSVVEQIELCEVNGHAIKADATDELEMVAAFAKAGPLDGLVISAGVFEPAPIREMTLDFWNRVLAANVTSSFLAIKHSLNTLNAGSIVLISSTAGQRGSSVYSAYATAKGAQIMFMRSMAKELAPSIRVNCVAPGWTETDMADSSLTELGREEVAKSFPLGRIGQPNDVADAIVFLLSDQSRFITGSTVTVDGGFDMRG